MQNLKANSFSRLMGLPTFALWLLPFSPTAGCRSSFLATLFSIGLLPSSRHSLLSFTLPDVKYLGPITTFHHPWLRETHGKPPKLLDNFHTTFECHTFPPCSETEAAGSTACSNFKHLHAWLQGRQDYTLPRSARVQR